MRQTRLLGVCLTSVGLIVSSAFGTEPPTKAVAHGAAMTVYKDPVTGEFGPPPAEVERALQDQKLLDSTSTSAQGLVQVLSPVPGGGFMVNLQGRFMSAAVATVDKNGKISIDCGQDHAADPKSSKPVTPEAKP